MWRFVLILGLALWIGGLTFYALVVVPIGIEILGTTDQGFVTQRVTNQLNLIGVGLLVLLLANVFLQRGRLLAETWLVLAVTQAALFVLHRRLDAMLAADDAGFYDAHRVYLLVTAVQWFAGLAHLWCVQSTSKISPASDTRTS